MMDPTLTTEFKQIISALRSGEPSMPVTQCLDDDVIALIADGYVDKADDKAIAHLSDCADCRARLVSVKTILGADEVKAELDSPQLTLRRAPRRTWRASTFGIAGTLAAAAVMTIVFLGPKFRPQGSAPVHRESAITTTTAPRIVSPSTAAAAGESLRWTSVPQADLYRVRVWDHDGTVVLGADTKDTTLALPSRLLKAGASYFWVVKARTGWDRWVSSDFVEFTAGVPRK
jgi:hypothetical protein